MKIADDVGENLRKGASKLTLAFYRHKYGSVEQQWSEEETSSIVQDALELYENYSAAEDTVISIANTTQMSDEEFERAKEIFAAYNAFRKAKGIHQVIWDDEMSRYAYGSATGCAATGVLNHGLGIPAQRRSKMSDLLQYSTWLMTGKEAVQGWAQSDGHKKMMQCASTVKAGAAVIRSNDKWYYAIVYDFVGSNQSA